MKNLFCIMSAAVAFATSVPASAFDYPAASVVSIRNFTHVGTGVFISETEIITTAHIVTLNNPRLDPSSISVWMGENSYIKVKRITVPDAWQLSEDPFSDLAIVEVAPVRGAGVEVLPQGILTSGDSGEKVWSAVVAGYRPGDFRFDSFPVQFTARPLPSSGYRSSVGFEDPKCDNIDAGTGATVPGPIFLRMPDGRTVLGGFVTDLLPCAATGVAGPYGLGIDLAIFPSNKSP